MGLFKKEKAQVNNDEYYVSCIQDIHCIIKDFTPGAAEAEAKKFKIRLDEAIKKFIAEKLRDKKESIFVEYKNIIMSFIKQRKASSDEKDTEFKSIISVLTEGITSINNENQEYNKGMLDHSAKLSEIGRIDNIKEIREGLKRGVDRIKDIVTGKIESDRKMLKTLSNEVSALKGNLKEAETQSSIDKLTGIYNRRAFDSHIKKLVDNAKIVWSPFAVMMIDIDNFKLVNDTHGHLIGDKVIVAVVSVTKAILRKDDFLARFGGEEFVVVMDRSSLKDAIIRARAICTAVSKLQFVVDKEKPEEKLKITVSIGVSSMQDDDTDLITIDRADKALYRAKRAGKNRAVGENEINES
ncbi:MAG: GGDEF domain-containing protein [Candidatus Anammoxibacter sp.]